MEGGAGDDTYTVDNVGDVAVELAGQGMDLVNASVSFILRAELERLTLTGAADINGTGNALANIVTGNLAANKLYGRGGDDRLYGGAGNDTLDGGEGVDRLYGGTGNDIYVVRDATDYVYENAGEGTDVVYASVHHVLRADIERLYLRGTDDLVGKGNELDNIVVGNSGANRLYGFDGNDRLYGGAGNDRLEGGNGNDLLDGDAGNDKIYGGDGADIVTGEDGNDWLQGGAGRDRMYGGEGADRFVFDNLGFGGATTATADQIHDFGDAEGDRIHLSQVDANSLVSGDQAFAWIGTDAFSGTAGELRTLQGSGNTFIQGDINGDGVADFLIRLDGLHGLGSTDFIL
jgi:Ca2+-binding RTX toxin-like protein